MKKQNKSFTIICIIVVIVIIAILAAVLIPMCSRDDKNTGDNIDRQLLRNLNTALSVARDEDGKNETMYDALQDAKKAGYDVVKINENKTQDEILWDSVHDVFVSWNENEKKIEYLPEQKFGDFITNRSADLWQTVKTVPSTQDCSIYWYSDSDLPNDTKLKVGFDAGDCTAITEVVYENSKQQNVVIRTNSDATILRVKDTTNSKISQYGNCGIIEAEVGTHTFYIEGNVGFVQLKTGHVVVNGFVEAAWTSEANPLNVKLEGNVKHAHASSETVADNLNNANPDLVVWDFDGDNGKTEKHPDVAEGTTTMESLKDEVAAEANSENMNLDEDYVARIGSKGYETLKAAIDEVSDNGIIVLLKDINLASSKISSINKTFTIDFANKTVETYEDAFSTVGDITLTLKNGNIVHNDVWEPIFIKDVTTVNLDCMNITSMKYCVYVSSSGNGNLNITNCKLTTQGDEQTLALFGKGKTVIKDSEIISGGTKNVAQAIQCATELEIENTKIVAPETCAIGMFENAKVTVSGDKTYFEAVCCISQNNGWNSQNIPNMQDSPALSAKGLTINGGVFKCSTWTGGNENGIVIYWGNQAPLTINGGYFEGSTALYVKNGLVKINGGTFVGRDQKTAWVYNGNGATRTGDAVVLEASGYHASNIPVEKFERINPEVTISGGTFTSENGYGVAVYEVSPNEVTLINDAGVSVHTESVTK